MRPGRLSIPKVALVAEAEDTIVSIEPCSLRSSNSVPSLCVIPSSTIMSMEMSDSKTIIFGDDVGGYIASYPALQEMLVRWRRVTRNLIRPSSQIPTRDSVTAASRMTSNRMASVTAVVVCCSAFGVTGTAKTSLCRFEGNSSGGLMSIDSAGASALQQYCSLLLYAAEVLFEQEVVKS